MKKYQFVADKILKRIEEGIYIDRLPTVRKLMEAFGVSQVTVTQALKYLVENNRIYAKPNVGYYIIFRKEKAAAFNGVYDFSTASTSWTDFPLDSYSQCLEAAIQNEKTELFTYGATTGNEELKTLFQKLLMEDQIFTKKEQIMITSGTQQALHILALIMLTRKESILIEQPTYHQVINLIERLQLDYVTCCRGLDKIDLQELEKTIKIKRPSYVYLMPRLHNPLGTTMNEQEKKLLLELAEKYDFYMIEDDYLGDFEGDNSYKTLYEMDNDQRVIYLKSFSKIMFPGQRLGITVVPEKLIEPFRSFKEIIDIHTNSLSQVIMQTFMESGLYAHHKDKIVSKHQQKAEILRHALNTFLSGYAFNDNHQMHTVIKLPKQINIQKLHEALAKRHVLVDDYKTNYIADYKQKHKFLKLNTTSIQEGRIHEGVQLIHEAIESSKYL
ncbi:PLP-dependent aminotransferase family protein [Oceanobacillus oncorhynchi]|uniref:aminotransferase-like domain-containing protein n=1 Tax=Oceanobacillus oncorhynchi TaxID=545501 RepID=UPI00211632AA|nr:PLP-dependent aminotransferase family protein [Oceanobacillus oncorhynchi]UUI42103.1 PLP-dependent aminotransferase family protein [Oceanobacillus oncorhynchi]